jgi:hypothetical protein
MVEYHLGASVERRGESGCRFIGIIGNASWVQKEETDRSGLVRSEAALCRRLRPLFARVPPSGVDGRLDVLAMV